MRFRFYTIFAHFSVTNQQPKRQVQSIFYTNRNDLDLDRFKRHKRITSTTSIPFTFRFIAQVRSTAQPLNGIGRKFIKRP